MAEKAWGETGPRGVRQRRRAGSCGADGEDVKASRNPPPDRGQHMAARGPMGVCLQLTHDASRLFGSSELDRARIAHRDARQIFQHRGVESESSMGGGREQRRGGNDLGPTGSSRLDPLAVEARPSAPSRRQAGATLRWWVDGTVPTAAGRASNQERTGLPSICTVQAPHWAINRSRI